MEKNSVGRKRKLLEEKSTVLMVNVDNKKLFELCDKYQIKYDKDAQYVTNDIKKQIISKIIDLL